MNIQEEGFYNVPIDDKLDLVQEINRLRMEKDAIILAHYYQIPEIQDIADFVGDSLDLSRKAASANKEIIVFAGVHFMAETAKILSPQSKVLIPDLNAGCSLADSCPPNEFKKFKQAHPDHIVISYINCSSEIKALSDIICTSTNAQAIVESLPKDQKIIFAPDRNLGGYLNKKLGKEMVLWDGSCIVHEAFSIEKIQQLKSQYQDIELVAHPECKEELLNEADFIGSTRMLLDYTQNSKSEKFIVITEEGILHQMIQNSPTKKFIPAPMDENGECSCGECPYMKLNDLQKLYLCLEYEKPEIFMNEDIRLKALAPMERMLDISKKANL